MVVGICCVTNTLSSLYPWYKVVKSVAALDLVNRVSDCVCNTITSLNSSYDTLCQVELRSIIGSGTSITNITTFCNEVDSNLNVAKAVASASIGWYSALGGIIFLGGTALIARTLYVAHKRSPEQVIYAPL
ncbi:MAG: hypothetical protein LLF94_11180 [Chlamydiales bacterium]|nr:hypothetical protein [Chlamydiales bacterium]